MTLRRINVLSTELGDPELGGFGGFGWATRRTGSVLAGERAATSIRLVTTSRPPKRAKQLDGTRLIVAPTGRAGHAWGLRQPRSSLTLTVDYHSSYFPLLLRLRGKAVVWSRDPRSPEVWDRLATLRLPSDPHTVPQGVVPGAVTSLAELDRRRGGLVCAVTSPALRDRFCEAHGFTPSDLQVLPNPLQPAQGQLVKATRPTVAFLGRLDPVKRPWIVVDVARALPDVQFVVMGAANLTGPGSWQPEDLPANVSWLGHADEATKRDVLASAWLLVNTSIHEGLPVSFLEALAHEVPLVSTVDTECVASRFGAYVGNSPGAGLELAAPIAEAIEVLLRDDTTRAQLGSSGRRWVETTHSPGTFLAKLRELCPLLQVDPPAAWNR